jgi:DNA-binding NtrC family response regulator
MRKQPASETNPAEVVTVLSVSPMEDDDLALQSIFNHSKWKLSKTHSLPSALAFLRAHKTPVVLCERDLLPGTWRDLVEESTRLPASPAVIVSSRLADDRLWAEALNLGAWDVLAKPFDKSEVFRAISTAWLHWKSRQEVPNRGLKVMRAAG